jgi:hypothetical protein
MWFHGSADHGQTQFRANQILPWGLCKIGCNILFGGGLALPLKWLAGLPLIEISSNDRKLNLPVIISEHGINSGCLYFNCHSDYFEQSENHELFNATAKLRIAFPMISTPSLRYTHATHACSDRLLRHDLRLLHTHHTFR